MVPVIGLRSDRQTLIVSGRHLDNRNTFDVPVVFCDSFITATTLATAIPRPIRGLLFSVNGQMLRSENGRTLARDIPKCEIAY
jgi:hypothetical protein